MTLSNADRELATLGTLAQLPPPAPQFWEAALAALEAIRVEARRADGALLRSGELQARLAMVLTLVHARSGANARDRTKDN